MAQITFITTGQPTTNPRLVKEAELLIELGYQVKVIYCFYQQWAVKFDETIIERNPDTYVFCGGNPYGDKFIHLKTRVRQKLCTILSKYTKRFSIPENAISRTHSEALKAAKNAKSDLYIAHNLGALPAAVLAAKYHNAKVGYDAEDMHSGQYAKKNESGYLLNKYIEVKYFKYTNYFTAASPLIGEHYKKDYPYLSPVVINNVFPKTNIHLKKNWPVDDVLKILWFSQTVGADRGLETVIEALKVNKILQLHLVGNCSDQDKAHLFNVAAAVHLEPSQLQFHPPMAPDALLMFAAGFDIGIASETASTLNRDICLTNKIFTYIQCGLAIVASDTKAQSLFLKSYQGTGKLYQKNDPIALSECFIEYLNDPNLLYQTRLNNYELGQRQFNWESEGKTFARIVSETLS